MPATTIETPPAVIPITEGAKRRTRRMADTLRRGRGTPECTCPLCQPPAGLELSDPTPGRRPLLPGRTLVLVDHENLCGGPDASPLVASAVWQALKDVCALDRDSQVVIGLSGFAAAHWMTSLPLRQVRLVMGDGRDGADRALLDSIDRGHVARRFSNVVIASGDHIFTDLALSLRQAGVQVCNVTSSTSTASGQLAAACSLHLHLRLAAPDCGRQLALAA